jgi:imidazoleglycerol-phosphate dehydratase
MAAATVTLGAEGADVSTGVPVLDGLLTQLAQAGGFGLALKVSPDEPEAEVAAAGRSLGEGLAPLLHAETAVGRGTGTVAADEALALVAVDASGRPLVASNADLTATRAGGLHTDLAGVFLHGLADSGGLTIHVRLMEGQDSRHVLTAIFRALGLAVAEACEPRRRRH